MMYFLKNKLVAAYVFCGILCSLFLVVFFGFSVPVYAAPDGSSVVQKTLVSAMHQCYVSGALTDPFETSDIFDLNKIVSSDVGNFFLPTNISNALNNTPVNCKQVFVGAGKKMNGILSAFGKPSNPSAENLGYVNAPDAAKLDYKCLAVNYTYEYDGRSYKNTSGGLCLPVDGSNKIIINNANDAIEVPGTISSPKGTGGGLKLVLTTMNNTYNLAYKQDVSDSDGGLGYFGFSWNSNPLLTSLNGQDFNEVETKLNSKVKEPGAFTLKYEADRSGTGDPEYNSVEAFTYDDKQHSSKLTLTGSSSALTALRWLTNNPDARFNDYYFDDSDLYYMYRTYFQQLIDLRLISVGSDDECFQNRYIFGDGNMMTVDGTKWCRVYGIDDVDKSLVFAGRKGNDRQFLHLMSFRDIMIDLQKLDFSQVDPSLLGDEFGTTDRPVPPDMIEKPDDGASCTKDAPSLGWILCPVLSFVGSATSSVYTNIADNWLTMDPTIFSADNNNGPYVGWQKFRDFANILFAIFFVVVILSQVTGIGLSNYNIKKVLPKLIIVAVLVNVSFLVCQIAVDLSNILGSGLYDLLHGLSTGSGNTSYGLNEIATGFLSTIGTTVLAGAGIGAFVIAAATSPGAVLLPLLLALLSALIAVLFFFVVLAVRKAGIIILVVLSPVAIICYALPNTKSLFDRWRKLFTSLLLVYPICGVLMGGGYFASNLLLKSGENGFMESLVAMLMQIIPLFFVPTILRSSLALAGNIGNRISGLGSRFGAWSTGSIRRSDAYQRASNAADYWGATSGQKGLNAFNTKLRSMRGIGKFVQKAEDSGIGRFLGAGQERRVANSKVKYQKMRLDEGSAKYISENMTEETIKAALAAQSLKQQEELTDADFESIRAGTLTENGKTVNIGNISGTESSGTMNLQNALDQYMQQVNMADAQGDAEAKDQALRHAQAVVKALIDVGGDTGRTVAVKVLRQYGFDDQGNSKRTAAFNGLSQYISRNGKWMASLKAEDTGSFRMISDGAGGTPMKDLHTYNTMGSDKVRGESVASLSDAFFDNWKAELDAGRITAGTESADNLIQLAKTFVQTMSNPNLAGRVKPETLERMQPLYAAARKLYIAQNPNISATDLTAKFGPEILDYPNPRASAEGDTYRVDHSPRATTSEPLTDGESKRDREENTPESNESR